MILKSGEADIEASVCQVSSVNQSYYWDVTTRLSGSLPLEPGDVCALIVKLPTKTLVSVAAGKVRWVQGDECGIETLVINEESEARLSASILERVKAL